MNSETFVEIDLMYFAGESEGHAPFAMRGVKPEMIGKLLVVLVGSCTGHTGSGSGSKRTRKAIRQLKRAAERIDSFCPGLNRLSKQ